MFKAALRIILAMSLVISAGSELYASKGTDDQESQLHGNLHVVINMGTDPIDLGTDTIDTRNSFDAFSAAQDNQIQFLNEKEEAVPMLSMDMASKPFIFMRHAETPWNRENLYMGALDIKLDEKGIEQAKNVARRLKGNDIRRVISSPLSRALSTGLIISDTLGIDLVVMKEFQQCCWGSKQGQKVDSLEMVNEWLRGITPNGAEPRMQFDARVLSGFRKTLQLDGLSLIVSHGGVYRAINRLLGLPFGDVAHCNPYIHIPRVVTIKWTLEPVLPYSQEEKDKEASPESQESKLVLCKSH